MAEKTSELSHGSVVWARMPGFAPWPARICSAFEKKKLMLQKTSKPNDIPVTFFGMRNESGWVIDTSVSLFTGESWKSKFDKKKFKSDKNYRAGVLEAVLLTKAKGQKYPSEVADLLTDTTKEFQDKVNHLCATCTGSSLSGDLTTCIYCDVIEVHWHCFHPDDPLVDEKFWICENCCKINKLEKGSVLTREQLLGNNKNESTSTTQITNSKNTEKNDEEGTSSKDKKKSSRKSLGDEKASTSTDHHHNSNASNKTGDNRLSSATIPRIESVEDDIINKDEDEVDDQCFVCGQDGELLMCDFPDCPRVYHPVCIMKIAPKPLTIDTCNDIYSNDITSSNNDDNLWFCPKHFCTICGILEKSKYTSVGLNQSLLLPSNLYLHAKELQYQSNFLPVSQAEQKNGTSSNLSSSPGYKTLWEYLNQSRTTRSCRTCPFTICNECEKNVYPHIQLFKGKRGHPHYSQCRNCAVPSDEVKLAKQLENAWVKIASSRLALPFLRPLLPFTSTSANPSSSSSSTLENQQQLESASYESRGDLTLILEHIHSLKYHSTKEFEEDLFSFRDYVYQKLYDHLKQFDKTIPSSSSSCASMKQQNEDILRKHDLTKVFYHSFETILEAGRNYIFSREIVFKEIEEEMRKKQLPQQTEVSAQPSSSSSSGRRGRRSRKRKQSESVEEERLSISEHQEPSGKAEDVMEVEETSSHTEKEISETVENGEMVVTNFDETSAIHEEMKKTEFKEVEAENVEAELDKEEMFLQKLWRIFCHKDPLHSLTKTLNHQNTISTVVNSTEDNQSSLPRFSSPSCFTQLYYDLPPRQITTNSTSATSSSPLPLIIPRSFQSWQQYLQEGIMPSKYLSNRLNDPTKALSNQKILQIRNQLLLNEETAFSAGPKETNETAKFNIFDHKFSKKVVKDLLFFHEDDEKRKMPVKMEIDKIDENQEKILNSDEILSQLKEEANQGNTHLQEEYEVANLLYSLNHDGNYTRENVTLATPFSKTDQQTPADAFELLGNSSLSSHQLRDTVLDPSLAPYQTMQTKITETPVFDETFVILNHLQSITEQTLALQMKLKQEYLRKQEQLFQYNHDVISFGELRLVTELKLANDNLRWRLEQRNVILQKYKETNQKLRLQLQQSEERTKELELQLQESKKSNGGNVVSEELSQQKLSLVERAVELTSAVERETSVGNGETVSDASTPITQESTANGSVNDDQSGTVTRGKRRKVQS